VLRETRNGAQQHTDPQQSEHAPRSLTATPRHRTAAIRGDLRPSLGAPQRPTADVRGDPRGRDRRGVQPPRARCGGCASSSPAGLAVVLRSATPIQRLVSAELLTATAAAPTRRRERSRAPSAGRKESVSKPSRLFPTSRRSVWRAPILVGAEDRVRSSASSDPGCPRSAASGRTPLAPGVLRVRALHATQSAARAELRDRDNTARSVDRAASRLSGRPVHQLAAASRAEETARGVQRHTALQRSGHGHASQRQQSDDRSCPRRVG
jgi:hypothetical protein